MLATLELEEIRHPGIGESVPAVRVQDSARPQDTLRAEDDDEEEEDEKSDDEDSNDPDEDLEVVVAPIEPLEQVDDFDEDDFDDDFDDDFEEELDDEEFGADTASGDEEVDD